MNAPYILKGHTNAPRPRGFSATGTKWQSLACIQTLYGHKSSRGQLQAPDGIVVRCGLPKSRRVMGSGSVSQRTLTGEEEQAVETREKARYRRALYVLQVATSVSDSSKTRPSAAVLRDALVVSSVPVDSE